MSSISTSERKTASRFQEPIREDLLRFRARYSDTLKSGIKTIDRVVGYLARSHGKGLRPTLTLLCAKLGNKAITEEAVRAAVIVELLHEATLVHDDVVDESPERRGLPSLASRYKNKIAVLFGDYMLANVLTETLDARDFRWLDILSETAKRMAKGELVQAARAKRLDLTEPDYIEMISNKTASLFSACCRLGGLTGGFEGVMIENLGSYGINFGIAFQIRDDLLDLFGEGRLTGKPIGGDLRERKLTLPLLKALSNASPRESRRIRAQIRRGIRRKEIKPITEFITHYEGDVYAENVLKESADKAQAALAGFPESPERSMLIEILHYGITRRK